MLNVQSQYIINTKTELKNVVVEVCYASYVLHSKIILQAVVNLPQISCGVCQLLSPQRFSHSY